MYKLDFEHANVYYEQNYLSPEIAKSVFTTVSGLFETEPCKMVHDKNDEPLYMLNRKTIVFVDSLVDTNIIPKIWGHDVTILEFPQELLDIKHNLETKLNSEPDKFNICLANYYVNGKKNIGWHSDNEEKGSTNKIASISIGAERDFMFRKIDSKDIYKKILLHSGSLIVMAERCQEIYQHCLQYDKSCKEPRLNLTFRIFDSNKYINY
jgi:hypothetical protein